jgi:hypothetical protein
LGYREKFVKLANRVFLNNLYCPPKTHKEVTFTLGEFIDFIFELVRLTIPKYKERIIKTVGEEYFEEVKSTGKVEDLIASDVMIEWGTKKPEDIAETLGYYNFRPQDRVGVSGGWRDYPRYLLEEIWEACKHFEEHPEQREVDLDKMILKIKGMAEKRAREDVYKSTKKEGVYFGVWLDKFESKMPKPDEVLSAKERLEEWKRRFINDAFQTFNALLSAKISEKHKLILLNRFLGKEVDKTQLYECRRAVKKALGVKKAESIERNLENISLALDFLGVTPQKLLSDLMRKGLKF